MFKRGDDKYLQKLGHNIYRNKVHHVFSFKLMHARRLAKNRSVLNLIN